MDTPILLNLAASPVIHWLAVLMAIAYVILAARLKIWCWLAGFLSAVFYTLVFLHQQAPIQVILNFVYMLIAVWGWSVWSQTPGHNDSGVYSQRSLIWHLGVCAAVLILSVFSDWVLSIWTTTDYSLTDMLLLWSSLVASVLTIYRMLQSWLYWIVIDGASAIYYFQDEHQLTSILFASYALFSIYGLWFWRRAYCADMMPAPAAVHSD